MDDGTSRLEYFNHINRGVFLSLSWFLFLHIEINVHFKCGKENLRFYALYVIDLLVGNSGLVLENIIVFEFVKN